jgi:HPt (histidine-containing phosphotransfer) domain-containing protein
MLATETSGGVIDHRIVGELRSIGQTGALFKRVVGLFLQNAPINLVQLREQAQCGERTALADSVHALKSMCSSIGARRASEMCERLELLARGGAECDMGSLVGALSREVHMAISEVAKLHEA